MGKFANELIANLKQAAAHAGGRKVRGMRVTKVELPDVKAIRRSLRMSQRRFAAAYRIPLPIAKKLGARTTAPRRAGGGLSARHRTASEGDHGSRSPLKYAYCSTWSRINLKASKMI